MAAQAKIGIIFDEHLLVNGAMRVVADDAALTHRFMLEHKRTGLRFMALSAALVLLRHGQAAFRFKNVASVRVVAIHTTHVAFDDGMMLRQVEFGLHVNMALEAGIGIFTRIDDELSRATGADMFAAWPVTGFTTAFAGHGGIFDVKPGMRARGEFSDDVRMAIRTRFIADVMRAGNLKRGDDQKGGGGTGHQKKSRATRQPESQGEN